MQEKIAETSGANSEIWNWTHLDVKQINNYFSGFSTTPPVCFGFQI